MPSGWEPERNEESWGDREAWRGDRHADASESWRHDATDPRLLPGDQGAPIDPYFAELDPAADEGWPEDLAGPEYWLFKRDGL